MNIQQSKLEDLVGTKINNLTLYQKAFTHKSAIKEYEKVDPPEVVLPEPVYSETGDGFFDEMRLSSPWMAQEDPSDSP